MHPFLPEELVRLHFERLREDFAASRSPRRRPRRRSERRRSLRRRAASVQ
jgi:hypothetical protein